MRLKSLRYGPSSSLRGFSLVELLVVISIIGMLMAVLLPVISSSRETARRTICAGNLRQSGLVLANYADAYKEYLPGNGSQREFHLITGNNRSSQWWAQLQEYGWTFKLLSCPSGKYAARFDGSDSNLILNYFYNGGYGDYTQGLAADFFYRYDTLSDNPETHRAIPRRSMAVNPHLVPLMSDMVRGPLGIQSTTGLYVRYANYVTGFLHQDGMPPNHLDNDSQLMISSGGNFMALDLSARWARVDSWTLRYRRQFQYLYWPTNQ